MQDSIGIYAPCSLTKVETAITRLISPDTIDYIYSENFIKGEGKRGFLYIKTKANLPCNEVANCLADWILSDFEQEVLSEIILGEFREFSNDERIKLLKIYEEKNDYFFKLYNHKTIVKKISNYLENQNHISIKGFLRFRLTEYRRELEMLLSEAAEELCAEQEYWDFVELIKEYIKTKPAVIDLLHIKMDFNQKFKLYDFAKKEISFAFDSGGLLGSLFSEEDKLMSVLISLAPKRIIWHNQCKNFSSNLKSALEDIFGTRFCECSGCELCNI